jgi:ribosomal protein S18 acetylase RimI-like enzyme
MSIMTEVTIRPAIREDAGEILTVQRAAYVVEGQVNGSLSIPPLTETVDELARAIESVTVLVATRGHRIVGSVRLRVADGTGHIGRLGVAPDLQGHGIGTRLLRAAEDAAPLDVHRFELFTGVKSRRNIQLYQHLGYRVIDPRPTELPPQLVSLDRSRTLPA